MKLIPAESSVEDMMSHRLVSENGLIHMGVFPVLYGHRVRAGFNSDRGGCVLDWCGGGVWKDVERLYALCKSILEKREENRQAFGNLPRWSNIKPFFLDDDFVRIVGQEAGEFELVTLDKSQVLNWDLFVSLMSKDQ